MKQSKHGYGTRSRMYLLILLVLTLIGCGVQESPVDAEVQSDVAGLETLIHLPETPEAVWWVRTRDETAVASDEADYQIVAVLQYDQSTLERLQNDFESDFSVGYLNERGILPWFPDDLKATLEQEGENGTTFPSFATDAFDQEPYLRSSVYVVHDYLVIYAWSRPF